MKPFLARVIISGISKYSDSVIKVFNHCSSGGIKQLDLIIPLLNQFKLSTFCWNSAIRGYEKNQSPEKSVLLYKQMIQSSVLPDKFTFPFVLKACGNSYLVEEGMQIHCQILKSPLCEDTYVLDNLLLMYSKCGEIEKARFVFNLLPYKKLICWNMMIDGYVKHGNLEIALELFECMPKRDIFSWNIMIEGYSKRGDIIPARILFHKMPERDTVSWNSMIDGYVKSGDMHTAKDLFDWMPSKDVITWGIMINGLSKSGKVEMAHCLFEKIPHRSLVMWNSLIHGYAKCDDLDDAHKLFLMMPIKNISSYNVMIDTLLKGGNIEKAHQLFDEMPQKDIVSWNVMIDGHARSGNMEYARKLFDALPYRDIISWNVLISGYKNNGLHEKVILLFWEMLFSGGKPDCCTLATVISVISYLGLYEHGTWVHAYLERENYPIDGIIGVSLIDMYSKCGYVDIALQFFHQIPQKTKDHWNSVISGVAIHGLGNLALSLFNQMEQSNVKPDAITFVNILNACSHAGLVRESQWYFDLMKSKYGISPTIQHFGCMVDILARSGDLDGAMKLLKGLPVNANDAVWRALLSASTNYGNAPIAEYAAMNLAELAPCDSSSYILLSSVYASRCQFESASELWNLMRQRSIRKNPGCSSVELYGEVREFRSGFNLDENNVFNILHSLRSISQDLMIEDKPNGTIFLLFVYIKV